MNEAIVWVTKLITAHLLTDFVLQPKSWVTRRRIKHFASPALWWHGAITGAVAGCFLGWQYWYIILVITVTHIFIDGWKSYRPEKFIYFFIDQVLHLLVILVSWYSLFIGTEMLLSKWKQVSGDKQFWVLSAAFVFLSFPAGIIIGQLTQKWRDQLDDSEGLADAGKWIGILERTIILLLLVRGQYEVIGLLVTAKSILRFNEKSRQEAKTEYVLIGSLISIGLALVTGVVVKYLV